MTKTYFDPEIIEAIAKGLGDTDDGLTNFEIDKVTRSCGLPLAEAGTKWQRIYNILAHDQNTRRSNRGILAFIRKAMNPAIYVKTPERYETLRENLNRALSFEGIELKANGKLVRSNVASTISEARKRASELRGSLQNRGVHPDVLKFCREELLAENYFHAVLEATKSLAQKIRELTGLASDGAALVDGALSGSQPVLAINALSSESERSEQKGFATLCKGIFGMFRNPTAHAPKIDWEMTKSDAEDLMSVLSLAHRRLDSAHVVTRT